MLKNTAEAQKRTFDTTKGRRSRARIEHWRSIAALEARKDPSMSAAEIASRIQRSKAGRKWEGSLTYSIDFIARNIRDAWKQARLGN